MCGDSISFLPSINRSSDRARREKWTSSGECAKITPRSGGGRLGGPDNWRGLDDDASDRIQGGGFLHDIYGAMCHSVRRRKTSAKCRSTQESSGGNPTNRFASTHHSIPPLTKQATSSHHSPSGGVLYYSCLPSCVPRFLPWFLPQRPRGGGETLAR